MIDIDVNKADVSANTLVLLDYPASSRKPAQGQWLGSSQQGEKKDDRHTERGGRQCPADKDSLGGLGNPKGVAPVRVFVETDIDVNST